MEGTTMANALVMREALTIIEQDPNAWQQTAWRRCFAAKVAEATGVTWWQYSKKDSRALGSDWWVQHPVTGEKMGIREYAMSTLEITDDEAEAMFHGDVSLEELQKIVGLYELREQARAIGHSTSAADLPVGHA